VKTRKELKEEFRQIKYRMGVFRITNQVNGKVFIGSSTDLVAIWHAQKFQLNAGMHSNEQLQKDWNRFGPEAFSYDILEELSQKEGETLDIRSELSTLEALVTEELQPYDEKGYNRMKLPPSGSIH